MAVAPLRAAKLRHKIRIYQELETDDGMGGLATSWSLVASPWAQCEGFTNRRGGEEVVGEALQGVAYFKIIIRYRDEISAAMQIAYGSLALNIKAAYDPDGRREQLWILADTASVKDMGV